ncbi:uncharacterized protein LOC105164351 isoform X3 [Sesamum indicum]|uniref:Uncharacterized protein LOC105164351 isoform X3 n=1 Tax=Sesamum indicum TaxID=4182 RepID=A0A8M8V1K8_SESIN|nr:uncharacterized protein LOC105164351 isoform X3 [Sesamum indicum]
MAQERSETTRRIVFFLDCIWWGSDLTHIGEEFDANMEIGSMWFAAMCASAEASRPHLGAVLMPVVLFLISNSIEEGLRGSASFLY